MEDPRPAQAGRRKAEERRPSISQSLSSTHHCPAGRRGEGTRGRASKRSHSPRPVPHLARPRPCGENAISPHQNHGSQRQWDDIFEELKEKTYQLRILHLVKLSFKNEGEFKTFPSKQKLRGFLTSRSGLQEMLQEVLEVKGH